MKVVWLLFHEHVIARCRWHVTLYVLNVDCPHLASCEMKVVWLLFDEHGIARCRWRVTCMCLMWIALISQVAR